MKSLRSGKIRKKETENRRKEWEIDRKKEKEREGKEQQKKKERKRSERSSITGKALSKFKYTIELIYFSIKHRLFTK